jgi:hypothetical protein
MASLFLYLGLASAAAGVVRAIVRAHFLFLPTRGAGLALAVAGAVLAVAALAWPAPPGRPSSRAQSLLDRFLPEYQFGERHERGVAAAPEKIDAAIREVQAREIRLFGLLTTIRNPARMFRRQPAGILNPSDRPILEDAKRSGFFVLADEPGSEIVLGTYIVFPPGRRPAPEDFASVAEPGYVKAVINFRIERRRGNLCVLTTETRVLATDPATARRFALYWRVIYPGSSLIRVMWLRAIARRAEK